MKQEIIDCFASAIKDESNGKKHKGLLIVRPCIRKAEEYLQKAKMNLELCELYKEKGFDYKIPEEWFYTLYYCALAILSRFGIESRSQKYTAIFLKYIKEKGLIEYDGEFIDRITVHKTKGDISDVDERERARYSSLISLAEVTGKYLFMTKTCKRAISQCEDIVFSEKPLIVPKELHGLKLPEKCAKILLL